MLQRIYYSPQCQYFYLALMAATICLILTTLIKGFNIDQSPLFILVECIINLLILADFVCRVRLLGVRRFLSGGFWNMFDCVVVVGCILLFLVIFVSQTRSIKLMEEVSEELLLIVWSVFQSMRMIIIAKKQKQA